MTKKNKLRPKDDFWYKGYITSPIYGDRTSRYRHYSYPADILTRKEECILFGGKGVVKFFGNIGGDHEVLIHGYAQSVRKALNRFMDCREALLECISRAEKQAPKGTPSEVIEWVWKGIFSEWLRGDLFISHYDTNRPDEANAIYAVYDASGDLLFEQSSYEIHFSRRISNKFKNAINFHEKDPISCAHPKWKVYRWIQGEPEKKEEIPLFQFLERDGYCFVVWEPNQSDPDGVPTPIKLTGCITAHEMIIENPSYYISKLPHPYYWNEGHKLEIHNG